MSAKNDITKDPIKTKGVWSDEARARAAKLFKGPRKRTEEDKPKD